MRDMILVLCNACERACGIVKPAASYATASPSTRRRFFLFMLDTTNGSWLCTNDALFLIELQCHCGHLEQVLRLPVSTAHGPDTLLAHRRGTDMDGVILSSTLEKTIIFNVPICFSVIL